LSDINFQKLPDLDSSRVSAMIGCHKCKSYYVTWDKQFPHGCKAMNFKSIQLPSVVVHASSGMNCMKYQPKEKNKDIQDKKNRPLKV